MKRDLKRDLAKARKSLGLNGESQLDILRKVRAAYELSNDGLAEALGIPGATLLAYLAPEATKKYRRMPEADLLVLRRILAEAKKK